MRYRHSTAAKACGLLAVLSMAIVILAGGAAAARELLEERNSTYNNIYVYKDVYKDGGKDHVRITMIFGRNQRFFTETVYEPANELALPVPYTRYMTVGLAYTSGLTNLLEIGFGGGRTAWYLHKHAPALDITAVELDPAVVDLAKKYFGVRSEERFKITVSDGRSYLLKSKDTWDVIMIDAYRGTFVPFHLLTEEFYKLVKSKLKPGGVVVQNIEPGTMMFDSAIATIQRAFPNVEFYDAQGNVVAVAYDGPRRTQAALSARADALQQEHRFRYPLDEIVKERRIVNRTAPGKVFTDDFAPVESLLSIEKHNKKDWKEYTEPPAK